jgi:hypothetical protein
MTLEERARLVIDELCLNVGDEEYEISVEWVLHNLNEAIAAETERCARIAENYRDYAAYSQMPKAIAAAIRAKAG